MGRQSAIDRLPPEIRDALNAWLRDPAITQAEAVERTADLVAELNERLPEEDQLSAPSKSSVNRYSQRMERVGERLRQSREVAQMWIDKLGAKPQGQLGNLVTEMLRSLAFELAMKLSEAELDEESLPGVIEMCRELSLTATRLEKATSENVKREAEIRKQEREKAAEEAAQTVERSLATQGMSREGIDAIKRDILGIN